MADGKRIGLWLRTRVPYEWILGLMFVSTFCFRSPNAFTGRVAWLLIVMPTACLSFRVKQGPPTRPRFGVPAVAAAIGWAYIGATLFLIANKHEMGRVAYTLLRFTYWTWPIPPVLSLASIVLAAVQRGRYRRVGVFANAALLLFVACWVDVALWR